MDALTRNDSLSIRLRRESMDCPGCGKKLRIRTLMEKHACYRAKAKQTRRRREPPPEETARRRTEAEERALRHYQERRTTYERLWSKDLPSIAETMANEGVSPEITGINP